jgi:hypothetical protein
MLLNHVQGVDTLVKILLESQSPSYLTFLSLSPYPSHSTLPTSSSSLSPSLYLSPSYEADAKLERDRDEAKGRERERENEKPRKTDDEKHEDYLSLLNYCVKIIYMMACQR